MHRENCFVLGRVVKKHGFNGAVTILLDTDQPQYYKDLESAFIEIDDKPIPFFFTEFQILKGNRARVVIDGINSEEKARELIGKEVLLPDSRLPELTGNRFYYHEIIGFHVIDSLHGPLGTVNDVIESGGHAVLQITEGDVEILVPAADPFIEKVDRKKRTLIVNTPDGLIELYK